MVNIEEPHDEKIYNVLDMLRIPVHQYPAMIQICEFITRRKNACVGLSAVIEVMLHCESYERKQDNSYTLLTDDDLNDLEHEVFSPHLFDCRTLTLLTYPALPSVMS